MAAAPQWEWPPLSTLPGWATAVADLWEATIAGIVTTPQSRQVGRRRVGMTQIERHFPVCFTLDAPTCTICLSTVYAHEPCRRTKCGHQFHADCIMKWWTREKGRLLCCPTCRTTQRIARLVNSEQMEEPWRPKGLPVQEALQQQQGGQLPQQGQRPHRRRQQQQQSWVDEFRELLSSWS